jgi:hypothetical protein
VETLRATCQELVELGDQQERLIAALLAPASSQRGIGQPDCLDLADTPRTSSWPARTKLSAAASTSGQPSTRPR